MEAVPGVTITTSINEARIAEVLGVGDVEQSLALIVERGIKPETMEALQMKAMLCMRQRKFDEAKKVLERLLREFPGNALTMKMMGDWSYLNTEFRKAQNWYGRALEKKPNDANIVHDYAVAVAGQGHLEEAIPEFRRAIELAPQRPDFKHHLAIMLCLAGHEKEGWKMMEHRLGVPGVCGAFPRPEDYWTGQNIEGKTLVVRTEQGFGDTIMFLRYLDPIRRLKPKKVYVFCQPEMVTFVKANWPWTHAWQHKAPPPMDFDYHVNVMSLPRIFPEGHYAPKKKKETGKGIGFNWFGSPTHKADHLRSIPINRFLDLAAEYTQDTWYCLGYGFFDKHPPNVDYLVTRCVDWQETIEAIRGLRLVVTVDTAIAHAAGFAGVPCWLLLPYVPDFRWGMTGDTTKWYQSLKLYRQPKLFDWDSVFGRIKDDLTTLLSSPEDKAPSAQAVSGRKRTAAAAP